jgi:hypothetical protein
LKYEATIKLRTGRRIDEEISFVSETWKSPDIVGSKEAVHFPFSLGDFIYYNARKEGRRFLRISQHQLPLIFFPDRRPRLLNTSGSKTCGSVSRFVRLRPSVQVIFEQASRCRRAAG